MSEITFTLPFIPKSLKNTKGLRAGRFYKPADITQEQVAMRVAVLDAMSKTEAHRPRDKSLFGDSDVAVETTVYPRRKETVVTVRSVGPKPKGVTGRRFDLGNVDASILDAMEGILYDNDRQLVSITATRVL